MNDIESPFECHPLTRPVPDLYPFLPAQLLSLYLPARRDLLFEVLLPFRRAMTADAAAPAGS